MSATVSSPEKPNVLGNVTHKMNSPSKNANLLAQIDSMIRAEESPTK